MKKIMILFAVSLGLFSMKVEAGIVVKTGESVGSIKLMNAVNNDPASYDFTLTVEVAPGGGFAAIFTK